MHGKLTSLGQTPIHEFHSREALRTVAFAPLSGTNNRPGLVLESWRRLRSFRRWECVRFELDMQDDIASTTELE
ncbi:MAG: hypothetical protein M1398_05255 [Deltaproteobacteria bacterium]|jgi:hypothetical protein|nr:hypothetical protein [Deltaproteobacteria bacterium]